MFEQQQFEFMEAPPGLKGLQSQLLEYAGLYLEFFRLYLHSRLLIAQNLFLSFKLQLWEIAFLGVRFQIFLIRLAHGFPLTDCWPRSHPAIRR